MAIAPLSQAQVPAETTNTTVEGSPLVKAAASKNMPGIVGNVPLDPTQTEQILQNMQQMLDEKTGFFNTLSRGLEDISAWGSGGKNGPTQMLAVRAAERRKEDEDIQKLRMDMAMTRAAAAQQANTAKSLDELIAGGGAKGRGGFSIVDPQIMQEVSRLRGLGRTGEAEKFYQDSLKKAAEVYAAPGMDEPKIPVSIFDPESNQWVSKMVSAREYRQGAGSGEMRDTPETLAAMKAQLQQQQEPPLTGGLSSNPIVNAIGVAESGMKNIPNAGGTSSAFGLYQITEPTFQSLKAKNADLKDVTLEQFKKSPELQTKFAERLAEANGKTLRDAGLAETPLNHYSGWFSGDTKLAAAPANTPIAKIMTAEQIKANPNIADKTAGQVRDMLQAGLNKAIPSASAQTTTAGRPAKPVSTQELMRQEEANLAYQKETGKVTAETWKKPTETFLANTEQGVVRSQINLSNRLGNLLEAHKDNPNVVGLLNDKGMANALATIARDGIQTPVGSLALSKLEEAYQKTIPGVKKEDILARQEIGQILAQYAQEVSRSSAGQGSVSDFERSMFQQIAGSTSNSPEVLKKVQETMLAKARFAEQSRELFNQGMAANKGRAYNFGDFQASKEYKTLVDNYFNKLESIGGPLKKAPTSQSKPATSSFTYSDPDKEKRFQLYKQQNGIK